MADRRVRLAEEPRAPQDGLVYDGVGATLRHARERLGLDLPDVAVALRIQTMHLDALERGRFQELPGPAYAVGFIRSYARYLRLDGEAAVAQFKAETSIAPGHGRLVAPEPLGEVRRPRGLLIGVSLLLAAAVYGGWMWLQERERLRLELIPPPPQSALPSPAPEPVLPPPAASMATAPAEPAALPAAPQEEAAAPAAPADGSVAPEVGAASVPAAPAPGLRDPATGSLATGAEAQPEAALPPQEVEEESTPPPTANALAAAAPPTLAPPSAPPPGASSAQVYGAANHDARVVIRATADAWVQVTGAGNEILLTRTLKPGDTYLAPNRSDLKLWTGNAGALEIRVDGVLMPSLGPLGAPRRDISLDPARLAAAGG